MSKTRHGAKITKRHDTAQTPFQRLLADPTVDITAKAALHCEYLTLNPAAIRREILALSDALIQEVIHHNLPVRPRQDPSLAGIVS